jgi:hypothetical protein
MDTRCYLHHGDYLIVGLRQRRARLVLHIGQRAQAHGASPRRQQVLDVAARHLQRAEQIHAQRAQTQTKRAATLARRHAGGVVFATATTAQRVQSVLGRDDHLRRDVRDLMPPGFRVITCKRCGAARRSQAWC